MSDLTKAQETKLVEYRDEWLQVGLDTRPAIRATAEASVASMYRSLSLPVPLFCWVDGPAQANVFINQLNLTIEQWDGLFKDVPQLKGKRTAITRHLEDNDPIWLEFNTILSKAVVEDIRRDAGDQFVNLNPDLTGNLARFLDTQLQPIINGSFENAAAQSAFYVEMAQAFRTSALKALAGPWKYCDGLFWGSWDSNWVAYHLFARNVMNIAYKPEDSNLLDLWAAIAKSTGWWYPFDNVCVMCERAESISVEPDPARENVYRLNNLEAPALLMRDGWPVYLIHGVRVESKHVVGFNTLTWKDIHSHSNAEVRRVLLDRYGLERFMKESNAKVISTDDWGRLLAIDLPGDEELRMVEVVNSTPEADGSYKNYMLRVPPTTRTPQEGVAWTFGKTPETYKPHIQT